MDKNGLSTISACLVVYQEEAIIKRCLKSIAGLVDEIIVIHDGPCTDRTMEIASQFTDKIFIREHIGEAEPHRAFSFSQANSEWILQIDADEYLAEEDHSKIRSLLATLPSSVDGLAFKWELWDGRRAVYFKGLQKMCLFRKNNFFYRGIPHEIGSVKGTVRAIDLFLHHQPIYNNISWKSFLRKRARWVPIHARYFFPERTPIECFNITVDDWLVTAKKIREQIGWYIFFEPLKMLCGQLKNGLWTSATGITVAWQQYVYYLTLYWRVWRMK